MKKPSKKYITRQITFLVFFFLILGSIRWLADAIPYKLIPYLYKSQPFYKAITSGDTVTVRERINKYPSELEYRFFGLDATPLHIASGCGDTNMISFLLKSGAEIEATGYRNICTPLHCAASSGHAEAVKFLIQHGAKIDAVDRDNKTPMHYAASNDRQETMKVLVKYGGNIDAKSPTNTLPKTPPVTPLIEAVTSKCTNTCLVLLELGAEADFPYLYSIIENQKSMAPLAPQDIRDKWDTIITMLSTEEKKRTAQPKDGVYKN